MTDSLPVQTLESVKAMWSKQANGYIAGRQCSFYMNERQDDLMGTSIALQYKTAHRNETRYLSFQKGDNLLELLDLGMVKLTHMAVNCGLIETTPKQATHRVTLLGTDWQSAELQLDGHTLRGVYSLDYSIKAGEEPVLKLGFSRSQLHLDQEFLPRNMQLEVEGMASVLDLLQAVVTLRDDGFKNEETGMDYAKMHSSDAEVALFRDIYEALTLYKAVMDDPESIVEVVASENIH